MLFVPIVLFISDGLNSDGYHRSQLEAELSRRGARAHAGSSASVDLVDESERARGIGIGALESIGGSSI
ncbi:hypothetical protein [Coriobacterium glomerans]|uniref:hypothetical protein n=1 Tax=Coriobacterium glomerans TaxID=33871 RepID=UPI0002EE48B9|nr:hypothetical protein [Coriobacterium glomerans]